MTAVTLVGLVLLLCAAFCAGMAVAIDACRRGAPADRQTRNGAIELLILSLVCAVAFLLPWAWLLGWLAKVW